MQLGSLRNPRTQRIVAACFAVAGVASVVIARRVNTTNPPDFSYGLRSAVIADARSAGKKTYSYTVKSLPPLGGLNAKSR